MSKVVSLTLTESSVKHPEDTSLPIDEINDCLKSCGFGKFHIKLLCRTIFGFVADVAVSNTTSYLLPSAECDLNMDLVDKGLLNAAPYLGMLFSTMPAGFLTDTFGRKIFLQIGYGGIFLCGVVAGSSQTFEVLLTAKFFEGLVFAVSYNSLISLTGELCHNGIRDRLMLFQASFCSISQIIIAAISWVVLTQDWKYSLFGGIFVFNSWNFYLYIMSLWALSACVLHSIFTPESPKYLFTRKKYTEAREILLRIYKENTGKPADTFPHKLIWANEIKAASDETLDLNAKQTFANRLTVGLFNLKPMFRKPLAGCLGILCLINLLIASLYNIMKLWFPQLSTIVEHKSDSNSTHDLCARVDVYTDDLSNGYFSTSTGECIPNKSGTQTYINSMVIGIASLLPYLVLSVLVKKVGKRVLMIAAGLICCVATFSLRWANSKTIMVALFAIDVSIAEAVICMNQATIIEYFPTTTRTLGISMVMNMGRLGTLFGNVAFPVLLNMECKIPFFTLAGLMLCVALLSFFLPRKRDKS